MANLVLREPGAELKECVREIAQEDLSIWPDSSICGPPGGSRAEGGHPQFTEIWQCDVDHLYLHVRSLRQRKCRCFGYMNDCIFGRDIAEVV